MKRRLLLFTLIFLMSGIFSVAQEKRGMDPWDVAKLKSVVSADMSDDGKLIAYRVAEKVDPTVKNARASLKLHMYDVEKKISYPFVTQGSIGGVAFRPKSNSITFLSKREGDKTNTLYEIPLSGGEAQQILSFETSISKYEWANDGKKLVFFAKEAKKKESKLPYEPIIYEENLQLTRAYVLEIGKESPVEIPLEGQIYSAHWSPDDSKIVIAVAPTALVDDSYMRQSIHVINAIDFTKLSKLDHEGKLGKIAWSPDGSKVAMIAGGDIHDPIAGRLKVVHTKDGSSKTLVPDFEGKFDDINWTDANTIGFMASEGAYTTLGSIKADGSGMKKMIDKGDIAFGGFLRAENGAMAMVGNTATHPSELFYMAPGSKAPEKVTNSNPWLADRLMGKQEIVTYKAKDGLEIEGVLIHPVDKESGKKYPMITVVHGGPEAHYNNGWLTGYSMAGQVGAAQGYAIFYPNYRGSTGRGEKFAKSSQGDPAGLEFDDIIDGIEYLAEQGMIDKDRVGVTGGSYGGYATAWMSTRHTEHFAAGVMFVGISNNISKWGTSDIPEEMYLVHSRKRIWEDYQFFLERSPIYYADQAKTPLLIMHGANDTRVDPEQSYELYRHIKTRTETPVRLVLYPGEGHGNRKSTAQFDYSLRMLRWFNTYLKEDDAPKPGTEINMEMTGK